MIDLAERYRRLEERVAAWARAKDGVRAAIVVGSRARQDHPADSGSDLDVLLFMDDPEPYVRDTSWLGEIDEVWTWITHWTMAGDPEHLVIYAGGARVDLVLVPASAADGLEGMMALPEPLCRGMRFLLDRDGWEERVRAVPAAPTPVGPPTQHEFARRAEAFWFMALYTAQQLTRGDLWWARGCDQRLKEMLLPVIEYHARATRGVDTWHNGRFMADWADPRVLAGLPDLWARYDARDAWRALDATIDLFRWVARETAAALGLEYPVTIDGRMSGAIAALRQGVEGTCDVRQHAGRTR